MKFQPTEHGLKIKERIAAGEELTPKQLIAEYGLSQGQAYSIISYWRKKLGITKTRTVKPMEKLPAPEKPAFDWTKLDQLDRTGRRKVIEKVATDPESRDGDRLKALDMLEELDRATSAGLGPRPPLTTEDKIDRLTRLLSAVGPEITEKALVLARKYWKEEAKWTQNVIYDGKTPENPASGNAQGPETLPDNVA